MTLVIPHRDIHLLVQLSRKKSRLASKYSAKLAASKMEPPAVTTHEIRQRIWMELARATQDRHHEWRTPVLATVGKEGVPNARTVVLRHADAKLGNLHVYTDSRSPKVTELANQPNAILVFWSKRLNWQLRMRVGVSTQTTGAQIDVLWKRLGQSAAAGDYLSASAPGDNLPAEQAVTSDSAQTHHLAILTAQVQEIDWLELARSGHRRALIGTHTWEWLVP
jgi:pyridoxamine 5'-phosphate oxidase